MLAATMLYTLVLTLSCCVHLHAFHMASLLLFTLMYTCRRGKEFSSIITKAEHDLRMLLGIPDDYQVSLQLAPTFPSCAEASCFRMLEWLDFANHACLHTHGLPYKSLHIVHTHTSGRQLT